MSIIISKGHNPGSRDDFVSQVKWLPGMGPKKAAAVYDGETVEIVVPPEKATITDNRIRGMVSIGLITTPSYFV